MKSVTNNVTLFVLDPLWESLVSKEQVQSLRDAGYELRVDSEPKPLKDVPGLFDGAEPRVLAINPDYIGWQLKAEDYDDIPNLKGLFTISTSFDWIDQTIANERGIPICNITNFSTQAVAEWATLVALSLARQIPRLVKDGFPLDYDQDFTKYRGIELKGKVAGIIGLGNIGSAIAERCQGLGMEVVYYSRSPKKASYKAVSLEELLKTADVVFPTMTKNAETHKLVTKEMTQQLKPQAIIVDVVDILGRQQLLDMVAAGKLYGYGFEAKPTEFSNYQGNVWAAPAYAWATYESMRNSEQKLIQNLLAAAKNKYPTIINEL